MTDWENPSPNVRIWLELAEPKLVLWSIADTEAVLNCEATLHVEIDGKCEPERCFIKELKLEYLRDKP